MRKIIYLYSLSVVFIEDDLFARCKFAWGRIQDNARNDNDKDRKKEAVLKKKGDSTGKIKTPPPKKKERTDCINVDSDDIVKRNAIPMFHYVFYTKRERSGILYQVSWGEDGIRAGRVLACFVRR